MRSHPVQRWLLVEDDDNDFLLFRRACRKALNPAPAIHRETDGAAAQKYLCLNPDKPGLIISDLQMPKLDGLGLLEWTRSNEDLRNIPFVVLSSSGADQNIQKAKSLGAHRFYLKPETFDVFIRLVTCIAELA